MWTNAVNETTSIGKPVKFFLVAGFRGFLGYLHGFIPTGSLEQDLYHLKMLCPLPSILLP
jgi:hypothetical protein